MPEPTKVRPETLFRFKEDEQGSWASTTTSRVATRWQRAGYPVCVLGRSGDGVPKSWEVKLAWTGRKQSWLRLLSIALSQWQAVAPASAPELARLRDQVGFSV
jgi:hypothetical protein